MFPSQTQVAPQIIAAKQLTHMHTTPATCIDEGSQSFPTTGGPKSQGIRGTTKPPSGGK
ncbi:hypothetical protein B0H12DRAFT_1172164 [Mycena haematopus]|nr:hypothetical protein B0H12DRAFT_1172164 [Mycena haematopus]